MMPNSCLRQTHRGEMLRNLRFVFHNDPTTINRDETLYIIREEYSSEHEFLINKLTSDKVNHRFRLYILKDRLLSSNSIR